MQHGYALTENITTVTIRIISWKMAHKRVPALFGFVHQSSFNHLSGARLVRLEDLVAPSLAASLAPPDGRGLGCCFLGNSSSLAPSSSSSSSCSPSALASASSSSSRALFFDALAFAPDALRVAGFGGAQFFVLDFLDDPDAAFCLLLPLRALGLGPACLLISIRVNFIPSHLANLSIRGLTLLACWHVFRYVLADVSKANVCVVVGTCVWVVLEMVIVMRFPVVKDQAGICAVVLIS